MQKKIEEKIVFHENKCAEYQEKINQRVEEIGGRDVADYKLDHLQANYHYNDGIIFGLKTVLHMMGEENGSRS